MILFHTNIVYQGQLPLVICLHLFKHIVKGYLGHGFTMAPGCGQIPYMTPHTTHTPVSVRTEDATKWEIFVSAN